ncbi:hypothetical protein EZV62_022197 [Acer yangbiense]|uniref:Transposase MuDR plant domain-containing protein n=1 Tax=Acer yangbiense TaxID=1000413 RepID=A0A5C7H7M4_9ROSI|nr:hypothetical protein EZV62_022197 [Acer yangbiense]
MDIFKIIVLFGNEKVELGECDNDHISLITLVHALIEKLSGEEDVPIGDFWVWAQLPWSGERLEVKTDRELVDVFIMFKDRRLDTIVFDVESACYVPTPPEVSSRPKPEPEVLDMEGGYRALGWYDLEAEMFNYKGDSDEDDDKDDENGYQLKSNNEYFSDSELEPEPEEVKIAKLMKGKPFKRMVRGEIKFHIGQTFDNTVQIRDIFREYAIQKGVILDRVKNDYQRQTYMCTGDSCPWRAHASSMIDRLTFMIKTLVDQYECHRVYNNKKAKAKWIATKFKNLVNNNHHIDVKVIDDLLRENYNISVETQRCDHVTKNMIEAFNNMLGAHRAGSYLELLKFIRRMVMRKFQERKEESGAWKFVLPSKVNAKILKHGKEGRMLKIITTEDMEYELLGPIGGYAVILKEFTCQCGG